MYKKLGQIELGDRTVRRSCLDDKTKHICMCLTLAAVEMCQMQTQYIFRPRKNAQHAGRPESEFVNIQGA